MTVHADNSGANLDEIDLVEIAKVVWFNRLFIIKVTTVLFVLTVIAVLLMDNWYKATVTMLPQSEEAGASKFSGLAALAGINLNSSNRSNEVFYADVLKSNTMLDKLISKKWTIYNLKKEMFLHEFLEIKLNESHMFPKEKQQYDLKVFLREKVISFSSDKSNGLMKLSVSFPNEPKLSADIANWLALELHEFNENYRQKKSAESLLTIETQLIGAKEELTKAENKLGEFQKSNKNYLQSVELQLEYGRLTREVMTENTVYTELRKQYEISKLDYEKTKETITILDKAKTPVEKDFPKRGVICLIVTFLSGFMSILFVLVKTKLKNQN